jgi:hypothetical protein
MKEKAVSRWLLTVSAVGLIAGCCESNCEKIHDVVIYGSSPAALSAAISAQRLGKTAVIVCPETRIGGLTTGGLGQTDIGNKAAFGGLALQFYKDVAEYYKDEANWTWQKRSDYLPDGQCAGSLGVDSMWTFEPSAALKILEGWEKKYGLDTEIRYRDANDNSILSKSMKAVVDVKDMSGPLSFFTSPLFIIIIVAIVLIGGYYVFMKRKGKV